MINLLVGILMNIILMEFLYNFGNGVLIGVRGFELIGLRFLFGCMVGEVLIFFFILRIVSFLMSISLF